MASHLLMRSRRGISLVEMLIVVVMIGLMLAVTLPKAGQVYDHTMVRSARTALTIRSHSA